VGQGPPYGAFQSIERGWARHRSLAGKTSSTNANGDFFEHHRLSPTPPDNRDGPGRFRPGQGLSPPGTSTGVHAETLRGPSSVSCYADLFVIGPLGSCSQLPAPLTAVETLVN
jgi:hypothetical protein